MFNLEPKLAFKLYDLLKAKFPEIAKEYPTASGFFYFLNSSMNEGEILIMSSKKKKKTNEMAYYNKEWTLTNILTWINDYCKTNGIPVKQISKAPFTSSATGQTAGTRHIFSAGDKGISVKDIKVPGAPRLNDIEVYVGDLVSGTVKNALMVSSVHSKNDLIKVMDKIFKA